MKTLAEQVLYAAIDEVNHDQDPLKLIERKEACVLLGSGSSIDALTLVRLLVEIERQLEEKTGKSIAIVDESTFEAMDSPFATIGSLIAHLQRLLD